MPAATLAGDVTSVAMPPPWAENPDEWKLEVRNPDTVQQLFHDAISAELAEDGFDPEVVISDFESWAYLYGLNHRIPVISIDNMQVINRCRHPDAVTGRRGK